MALLQRQVSIFCNAPCLMEKYLLGHLSLCSYFGLLSFELLKFLQVNEALGAMKFPYIYPDPESRTLRAALAEDSGLESEYILAGCGADELIDLIMR